MPNQTRPHRETKVFMPEDSAYTEEHLRIAEALDQFDDHKIQEAYGARHLRYVWSLYVQPPDGPGDAVTVALNIVFIDARVIL